MKKMLFIVFALLSVLIGLYPLIYFMIDPSFGLLSTKPAALFENKIWYAAFYTHILIGGLSLLVGWSQFHAAWRKKRMDVHRLLGKIYVLAVLLSGLSAAFIAYHATGGMPAKAGFFALALLWLGTTAKAYFSIKNGDYIAHERWMIYSFALCWAAVTLRIWLPLLIRYFEGAFIPAYQVVAWLSWVPNLLVAFFLNQKRGLDLMEN